MSQRPRIVITCDGTETGKRHESAIVRVYERDESGAWLPTYVAVSGDGQDVILNKSGDNADAEQFDWRCPNRRCAYRHGCKHPASRVADVLDPVLDQFLAAGVASLNGVPLRFVDQALRHTAGR